jgi:hypothetical protein
VTCFGGPVIMARLEAIGAISGHTKVDWTVKHLLELDQLCVLGQDVKQIASHFGATVPEIEWCCRKLRRRRGKSLRRGAFHRSIPVWAHHHPPMNRSVNR